ncbi:MAG: NTP transferase domain-containing protein, partial [Deltaproteobacteria bacterium]|nr:NTP transferase domain-containing protein [Deltaproteobacteria bacterium]
MSKDAPYEAVILAAGRGSRLSEETHQCPKAILPIGRHTLADDTETNFLRRQVEQLFAAGVERVAVVVGYRRDQIATEMTRWERTPDVVVNPTPDIKISGSLHSFQFASRAGLGVLDGTHQTLLLDADIVYHRGVLGALLDAPEE